jgi:hypothetical protein
MLAVCEAVGWFTGVVFLFVILSSVGGDTSINIKQGSRVISNNVGPTQFQPRGRHPLPGSQHQHLKLTSGLTLASTILFLLTSSQTVNRSQIFYHSTQATMPRPAWRTSPMTSIP